MYICGSDKKLLTWQLVEEAFAGCHAIADPDYYYVGEENWMYYITNREGDTYYCRFDDDVRAIALTYMAHYARGMYTQVYRCRGDRDPDWNTLPFN